MTRRRRRPAWADTGLTPRNADLSDTQFDEELERRIREEMAPVITRQRVERLTPKTNVGGMYMRVAESGLLFYKSVKDAMADKSVTRCHIDIDNIDRVLTVTQADDGMWSFPLNRQLSVGTGALVRELQERGVRVGLYECEVVGGNKIVVRFASGPIEEAGRRAG